MKKDKIFISYRRSDAAGSTIAIRKTLIDRFGEQAVFRDVEGIDPGAEFPKALRDELKCASVVLAVIGKNWLLAANEFGQRRIDFEDDWVRTELSVALSDPEIIVVPVLVDGARIPPDNALPVPLRRLTARNAVTLLHEAWDDTIRRLLETIARALPSDEGLADAGSAMLDGRTGRARPDPISDRRGASEALTLDLIRQAMTEALEHMNQPGEQVLRDTVDEISRLLATLDAPERESEHKVILELLTSRLIGRPVAQVASCMEEVLRFTFSLTSTEGKWLGYALKQHSRDGGQPYAQMDLLGCVVLLPGNMVAAVRGAFVVARVTFDYYGASMNDGPYIDVSPRIVEVGLRCGPLGAGKPGVAAAARVQRIWSCKGPQAAWTK